MVCPGAPLITVEATGSLHRAWTAELERRFPDCVRLIAPSETQAARAQLGSRRFKSDDRDCAALVWLARQGLGRKPDEPALEALLGVVRHRRQLVAELKVLRQRLHDQLNRLCPGLSSPAGSRPCPSAIAAVGAGGARLRGCLRRPRADGAFAARPRSRTTHARQRQIWAQRWRACLAPPRAAELRAQRLAFDLERLDVLLAPSLPMSCETLMAKELLSPEGENLEHTMLGMERRVPPAVEWSEP